MKTPKASSLRDQTYLGADGKRYGFQTVESIQEAFDDGHIQRDLEERAKTDPAGAAYMRSIFASLGRFVGRDLPE